MFFTFLCSKITSKNSPWCSVRNTHSFVVPALPLAHSSTDIGTMRRVRTLALVAAGCGSLLHAADAIGVAIIAAPIAGPALALGAAAEATAAGAAAAGAATAATATAAIPAATAATGAALAAAGTTAITAGSAAATAGATAGAAAVAAGASAGTAAAVATGTAVTTGVGVAGGSTAAAITGGILAGPAGWCILGGAAVLAQEQEVYVDMDGHGYTVVWSQSPPPDLADAWFATACSMAALTAVVAKSSALAMPKAGATATQLLTAAALLVL